MKKFFLPFLLLATFIIVVGGAFFFSKDKPAPEPLPLPSSSEYFWGDGCPHCVVVEDFLSGWEGRDKVQIEKMEVWSNAQNARRLQERATYCGLKPSEVGVPFLFTPEGKCLSGDEPIINLFKSLSI